MKKKITLSFDGNDWHAVRWVINSFHCAVDDHYLEGAPRRIEAAQLAEKLHKQARKQVRAMGEDYDT